MLRLWHPYSELGLGNLRRTFTVMEDLSRDIDALFGGSPYRTAGACVAAPTGHIRETEEEFVLRAEVPGLSEKDVEVTVKGDTLSIRGERVVQTPEGYSALRQERGNFSFERSYTLPAKVDAEKAKATVRDGVFELVLPKSAEAQPRKIAVLAN